MLAGIHVRFGLPRELPGEINRLIKAADQGATFLEATTRLARFDTAEARRYFGRAPVLDTATEQDHLSPWPAETAETRYLDRFGELTAPAP